MFKGIGFEEVLKWEKESGYGCLGDAGKEREYEGIPRGKGKYKPGFPHYFLGTAFREQNSTNTADIIPFGSLIPSEP